jgi:hypothetical protein
VQNRIQKPVETTFELVHVLESVLGKGFYHRNKKSIHPATLIFQALRIAVNQELDKVEKIIPQAVDALNPQGRLAIISFHSLEDRIVKQQFRYYASDKEETRGFGGVFLSKEPLVKEVTRKPLIATPEEIQEKSPFSKCQVKSYRKTMKTLIARICFCIGTAATALYMHIASINEVTALRLAIPEWEKEVNRLTRENERLQFEIERFESPIHLMELAKMPEYGHLKHPFVQEVIHISMTNSHSINKRWVALSLGIFTLFSLLVFQFFRIQVLEHEKWSELAKRQHLFLL